MSHGPPNDKHENCPMVDGAEYITTIEATKKAVWIRRPSELSLSIIYIPKR